MDALEIIWLGEELTKRSLRTPLLNQLREVRKRLSNNTVWRAFEEPECDTVILNWIRDEARAMLAGLGVTYEAGVLEGA